MVGIIGSVFIAIGALLLAKWVKGRRKRNETDCKVSFLFAFIWKILPMLIKAVTQGVSYERLKASEGIPCCKDAL